MKKKISLELIERIRELKALGKTQNEIASILSLTQSRVCYWLSSDEKRKEISQRNIKRFMNKSLNERRIAYLKRNDYMKSYMKQRYSSDPIFRQKAIERSKAQLKKES